MKKTISITLAVLGAAVAATAQDGAALYKSKCLSCHGPKGAGKPALKGTNLASPEAVKASDDALADAILNGGAAKKPAHAYGKKGVTPAEAKALVAYIRSLQK